MLVQSFCSIARRRLSGRTRQTWSGAGDEPSLSEVLADPLVHLVMRRDGVTRSELEAVIAHGRTLLRRRLCRLCAA